MSDLEADLDTLYRLGGTLAGHADAIGQIKVSATVTMADSPVQELSTQVGDAVSKAFGFLGGNIRQMSDATQTSAKSYAEVEQVFADRLRRYTSGEQPR
ncbi:hypothetical protein GZH49_25875 [Nocardia terpenica]|uniref:hypothetical protein n=1 Tax=Nocardia terpenica TaxID=455432 RepID=UPI002FE0E503